jgi:hypothetical protein
MDRDAVRDSSESLGRPRTEFEFRAERLGSALRGLAAELVDERRKVVELRREIAQLRSQLASNKPTQTATRSHPVPPASAR